MCHFMRSWSWSSKVPRKGELAARILSTFKIKYNFIIYMSSITKALWFIPNSYPLANKFIWIFFGPLCCIFLYCMNWLSGARWKSCVLLFAQSGTFVINFTSCRQTLLPNVKEDFFDIYSPYLSKSFWKAFCPFLEKMRKTHPTSFPFSSLWV